MNLKYQTFLNSFLSTGPLVFFLYFSYGKSCCVANSKSKLQRNGCVNPVNLSQMLMASLNKWLLWKSILSCPLMIIFCLEIQLGSNKASSFKNKFKVVFLQQESTFICKIIRECYVTALCGSCLNKKKASSFDFSFETISSLQIRLLRLAVLY